MTYSSACSIVLTFDKDMCSYNVEQARGDDRHNIVTIIMHQHGTDIHGAMEWIASCHQQLLEKFLEMFEDLPQWTPEVDIQVARYVDGLGNWVRANDSWSFESQRYFGTKGLEIQETRVVALLPKVAA